MSIFDKQKDKAARFAKATANSTEGEKRNAESKLLKPEPIPAYTGKKPQHKSELDSRTALIVFKDKVQSDLIGEIFAIRTSASGETYITDISLLELIAKKVRDGEMVVSGDRIDVFDPDAIPLEMKDELPPELGVTEEDIEGAAQIIIDYQVNERKEGAEAKAKAKAKAKAVKKALKKARKENKGGK